MRSPKILLLLTALSLLAAPALGAPGKAALKGPLGKSGQQPAFEFSNVSGSTWYYLWVSDADGPIHQKWYRSEEATCDATQCTIAVTIQLKPGPHRWWVQTYDASGYGPWSDRGDFDVDPGYTDLVLPPGAPFETVHWIDHLGFRPGSDAVEVSFDAFDSGVGAGATGLLVMSGAGPVPRVIEQGLAVPPGLLVKGVRVCFESSAPAAQLAEVRIEQLQDPPDVVVPLLVDAAGFASTGPVCVDSAEADEPIDPSEGGLRLQLGFALPDPPADPSVVPETVVVRGVGLHVMSDPEGPIQQELAKLRQALEGHTHEYLTGRGVGHNNTRATTSGPLVLDEED